MWCHWSLKTSRNSIVPPFPLNTSQLVKYDLKFVGDEQIDEILCYIFQVKPKGVDRSNAYFEGVVWVDAKYLEVVKTYGKWVNELGDVKIANMPFTTFETYRENVDGKYWFQNYQRSDGTVHLKDAAFPVRLVIKWSDFKPLPAAGAASSPTSQQLDRGCFRWLGNSERTRKTWRWFEAAGCCKTASAVI